MIVNVLERDRGIFCLQSMGFQLSSTVRNRPIVEAIEEFVIQTSNDAVEFERA